MTKGPSETETEAAAAAPPPARAPAPASNEAAPAPASNEAAPAPASNEAAPAPAPDPYPKPRPPDEPPAVVELRGVVEAQLEKLYQRYLIDDHGSYILGLESARVFVVPTWIEDGPTVVRIFAITNLDVPVTPELSSYLLAKNLEFVLGGFALDVNAGAVWFNHNLLGQFMAPEELESALAAVLQTANAEDDAIKSRFGGRLYVESADRVVPPPPTAGYL